MINRMPELKFNRNVRMPITLIDYHPGRIQPFTIWFAGRVIWFAYTYEEARRILHERQLLKEDANATKRIKAASIAN